MIRRQLSPGYGAGTKVRVGDRNGVIVSEADPNYEISFDEGPNEFIPRDHADLDVGWTTAEGDTHPIVDGPIPKGVEIGPWIDAHEEEIFQGNEPGELADRRVRADRKLLLRQTDASEIHQPIRQLIFRGVSDGQWVGKGLCDILASQSPERHYQHRTQPANAWNHYASRHGQTISDHTWKQFFSQDETRGKSPIFNGTAAEFRALGLDPVDTESYLDIFRLGQGQNARQVASDREKIDGAIGDWLHGEDDKPLGDESRTKVRDALRDAVGDRRIAKSNYYVQFGKAAFGPHPKDPQLLAIEIADETTATALRTKWADIVRGAIQNLGYESFEVNGQAPN